MAMTVYGINLLKNLLYSPLEGYFATSKTQRVSKLKAFKNLNYIFNRKYIFI